MEESKVILYENDRIKVERIESFGVVSPPDYWYEEQLDEFVTVVSGIGVIELFNGERIELSNNKGYYIPSKCRHKVAYTSMDCVWLCVYLKK